jgi:hypothetical protein
MLRFRKMQKQKRNKYIAQTRHFRLGNKYERI